MLLDGKSMLMVRNTSQLIRQVAGSSMCLSSSAVGRRSFEREIGEFFNEPGSTFNSGTVVFFGVLFFGVEVLVAESFSVVPAV